MEKRRAVVTGIGSVTPFGIGVKVLWENLIAGNSGIRRIQRIDPEIHVVQIAGEVPNYTPEDYLEAKEIKRTDRFVQFALIAAEEAYTDSGLDFGNEDMTRVGVISGSGAGGFITIEQSHKIMLEKQAHHKCSPYTVPMLITNMSPGKISMHYGTRGISKAVTSACSTGAHAIGDAYNAIRWGDQDIMFAGGTEALICDMGIGAFTAARTLTKSFNETPEKASRPFDTARDGFVMSEGGSIIIIEELEHALKRGAKIYGEIVGYGQTSDAYDPVAPDPEGKGAELAVRQALTEAGITPEDVQYINAHGTSTHLGDIAESQMIQRVFGDREHNKNLLVSSTKSMIGHLIAGAGSTESVICLKAISEKIVPPTINLDNQDPEVGDLDYVANKARKHDVKIALNNSFGFGGCNATLLFKEYK